jgi:hypothetical protein
MSVFAKGPLRADRALKHNSGFCHGHCDDLWINSLFGATLVKEIAICSPCLQRRRLHRRRCDREIEKAL